ncbi:hypothetical protein V8G54_031160 [Vigna mungo]|uniref:Uncharacterized protein n=1 Tax=Vigna mungo TaxID=3915 RepID=A0AAQ3MWD1_VIGMU
MPEPESLNHEPVPAERTEAVPESGSAPEPVPNPQPKTEPVRTEQAQAQLGPKSESKADPAEKDADLRKTTVRSNEANANPSPTPQLRKDEGSRTFTMRELLNGLKNDSEPEKEDANSPYSPERQQQHAEQNNAAMDLINSVVGVDDEGRSRQRILTFAARRYATAIERNPEDYDALYNWALVLQESADNVSPDSTSPSKDALLEEACKKYDEATLLCPTLHDVCCPVKELLQIPPALCSCMDLDGSLSKTGVCLSCVWLSSQFDWDACKVVDAALLMRQQWRKALLSIPKKHNSGTRMSHLMQKCKFILGCLQWPGWVGHSASKLNNWKTGAFYNWAIAISDRAKMRGRTKEAEELWKQATRNYEKAVQLNWNSPQALNNWGLALQELSAIVPAREKQKIVRTAISKFRAAIQLQFDFHRAIYNLGTVLYGLAEDTLRTGGSVSAQEVSPNELYSQSAIYIAAAHALKPNYSVYSSALRLVRSMLPLPHLKVGYLTAPPVGSTIAPHNDWKRSEFLLDHEKLQQVPRGDHKQVPQSLSGRSVDTVNADKKTIKVNIADIISVSACADLTLPPGAGLCIDTSHGSFYLVADSWESLDGWLDALRLVYTIYVRGKSDVLAGIITG